MKIALITDAWQPQVNGVVTTLVELVREMKSLGHEVQVIHPGLFKTRPCPGYAGIDLAINPKKELARLLEDAQPDAVHIATEGPLGWAGRNFCLKHGWPFTTAFHTRFPEILKAALRIPLWVGYAIFRHFHKPSAGVMVPTQSVLRMLDQKGFRNLKSWTHGVDMQLFEFASTPTDHHELKDLVRPISLFVGRVSYEKNIDAFLKLNIPGTKVVCGVGPLELSLKEKYQNVHWLGLLPREELAKVYACADVFVMSSKSETFGLVMLEAMACGTPVAAYPVEGPIEVMGTPAQGGVLHDDLGLAWRNARSISRHEARERALTFSWAYSALLFAGHLVNRRSLT